jgi:hypothetical protein
MKVLTGRADVLVDADNVSAPRESVAEAVVRHAQADGFAVSAVHVVGRSLSVLSDYVRAFRALSPTACITSDQAPPGHNSADVLAALWLGRISQQVPEPEDSVAYRMYVMSRDNLVLAAARRALGERNLVVPADASPKGIGSLRTIQIPSSRRDHSSEVAAEPAIPQWALESNDPANYVGLDWVSDALSSQIGIPEFVPFPAGRSPVKIGSAAGGRVDIDLSAWAPAGSLYSPHVVFEYAAAPLSSWTLRSTHGHRAGKQRLALNGRLISAASGPCPVSTGATIDIGLLSFRFRDNTLLNHVWFENPKDMIERLERGFRALAANLPPSCLPDKVRLELVDGVHVLWENAFIRHYEQLFAEIWRKEMVGWVDATFRSRTEIRSELGSLNRIRNVLFHPSRGAIAAEDLRSSRSCTLGSRVHHVGPLRCPPVDRLRLIHPCRFSHFSRVRSSPKGSLKR